MKATVPYIEQKFKEFNHMIFDDKLPEIPIFLADARTFLGKVVYDRWMNPEGIIERYNYRLRINTRIDLTETELEDVIIHEMIHYYIYVNEIKDSSAHGRVFRQMMNDINEKYGRHITISYKYSEEQRLQSIDKRQKIHIVAVLQLKDGRCGIKVLSHDGSVLTNYYCEMIKKPDVASINFYLTNNSFFNQYPSSSAYKYHIIDKSVLNTLFPKGIKQANIIASQLGKVILYLEKKLI